MMDRMLTAPQFLIFGDFRFNVPTRELLRIGTDRSASPVSLGSRAAEILLLFLRRPGELVSKNEIMDAVWPDTAVEEANLTVQISALRRTLGASCIQTVPGRGYRWTPRVVGAEEVDTDRPVAAPRTPAPVALGETPGTAIPSSGLVPTAGPPTRVGERGARHWGFYGVGLAALLCAFTLIIGLAGSSSMWWPASVPPAPNIATTQRIAVVIGNSKYRILPGLDNPERDAEKVASELEQRGFRVIKAIDADRAETIQAITDFETTLSVVGGVGVFYYAGRAAYIDGEDIMLPVDAIEDSKQSRIEGGVNLTRLQAELKAKTTRKMADNGSTVIYSASKGQVAADGPQGKNSPFTLAFLEALTHEEDELGDFFRRIRQSMDNEQRDRGHAIKQTPFIEDSRAVKFYFNRPQYDRSIGMLKILVFDSCRDNPFKIGVVEP
jgi:DNA-binding winged helix-turn-helix (wHTH) protein